MNEPAGNGTVGYRLGELERRVGHLESLEPAVVRSQLEDVKNDIHQLSQDLAAIRKILIGFLVTFAFSAVTTVIAVVAMTEGGR